jgi:hypothetical protein
MKALTCSAILIHPPPEPVEKGMELLCGNENISMSCGI